MVIKSKILLDFKYFKKQLALIIDILIFKYSDNNVRKGRKVISSKSNS